MPDVHATLSASSSSRWIACPPSARLAEQYEDTSTEAAAEGTAAHAMAEVILRAFQDNHEERMPENPEITKWFSPSMREYVEDYVSTVESIYLEAMQATPDAVLAIEQRVDYGRWAPGGFGTSDAVIIGDGTLHVVDLKYGRGVPVEAEGNPQLRLYALGAYDYFSDLYAIDTVEMTICQPRLGSTTTAMMKVADLLCWADHTVVPAASLAYKGEGERSAGSHCKFCPEKWKCRAYADQQLALVQEEFKDDAPRDPNELSPDEIASIITRGDEFVTWVNGVKKYALETALAGTVYPGYKVVAGRSMRRIEDKAAACRALAATGAAPDTYMSLKTIGDLEDAIGAKRLASILGDLIVKPQGKPTLAPESDKRPPLSAADDFKEEI